MGSRSVPCVPVLDAHTSPVWCLEFVARQGQKHEFVSRLGQKHEFVVRLEQKHEFVVRLGQKQVCSKTLTKT